MDISIWSFLVYLCGRTLLFGLAFFDFTCPNKKLFHVFGAIILLSIAFRMYTTYTNPEPWFPIFLNTVSRIDVIVVGALGALCFSKKPFQFKLDRITRLALLFLLIVALCVEPVSFWDSVFLAGFKKYFYITVLSILLLDFNFNSNFKHWLRERSFFHYLGKVSYGIYMYSNFILLIVIKKIMWANHSTNIYLFFSVVIAASLIIPIISYELIEKHILKFNQKYRIMKTDR